MLSLYLAVLSLLVGDIWLQALLRTVTVLGFASVAL